MIHVVIVGDSAGGLASPEALRRRGYEGTVTLIGDESTRSFDRPLLDKQPLTGLWTTSRIVLLTNAE